VNFTRDLGGILEEWQENEFLCTAPLAKNDLHVV
jgi:hypothetical protein